MKNLSDIEGFGARLEILDFGHQAASQFGQIKASLEKTGSIIGPYDMMIAGHARSLGLILVTNNVREFSKVDGIQIENWLDK